MLLSSRLAALGLALVLLAGCDSNNPGGSLADLDGTYVLEELVFDPAAGATEDADVGARLDLNVTRLEIYGRDGEAELTTQFNGQARSRTSLLATASRGRLTLSASTADDQRELNDLLLPPSFSLNYDAENRNTLVGNISRTGVNLEAFDPSRYATYTSESGTLRVRFSRL